MARLNDSTMDEQKLPQSHYGYSAVRPADLGATEYTLASVAVDCSGSVSPFKTELEKALSEIAKACKYSPRADNLMLRMLSFDDTLTEINGFKLLENIDPNEYIGALQIGGSTALYDAGVNSADALTDYAKALAGQDFQANGIIIVITDGDDNSSHVGSKTLAESMKRAVIEEALESVRTILVGVNVNDRRIAGYLQDLKVEAGFDQYIELDKADAKTLAKLAAFVSKSISAQSASLGTGGPSQPITI